MENDGSILLIFSYIKVHIPSPHNFHPKFKNKVKSFPSPLKNFFFLKSINPVHPLIKKFHTSLYS